jgi:hypothetical protein
MHIAFVRLADGLVNLSVKRAAIDEIVWGMLPRSGSFDESVYRTF